MSSERPVTASRIRNKTRQRPRRSIVLSQSSSSQKSEKGSQGESWYSIKDIVAEKRERGKLWYKIDWADDPVTGKVYDQSWILAQDANEEAVEDWEEKKQQDRHSQRAVPSSSPDRRSASQTNERSRSRGINGTEQQLVVGNTEEESDSEVILVQSWDKTPRVDLTVEIKQDPDFDRSEYRLITSSEIEPSFPAGPQSLQISQAQVIFEPAQGSEATPLQFDSQDTIPDSQDFPSVLSGGTHSTGSQGKATGPPQNKPQATSSAAPQSNNSGSSGPLLVIEQQISQLESGVRSRLSQTIEDSGDQLPSGQLGDLSLQLSTVELPGASSLVHFSSQDPFVFLTQAPFVSESPAHETSSPAKILNPRLHQSSSIVPDSVQQQTTLSLSVSGSVSATASTSQAAQVVSPLGIHHGELVIESQIPIGFSQFGDGSLNRSTPDIIPETTRKKDSQRQQNDSQTPSSALSKVYNNVRRSFAFSPNRVSRSTPRVAASSQDSEHLVSSVEEDHTENPLPRGLRSPVSRPVRNTITPSSPTSIRTQNSPHPPSPVTPSQAIMAGTTSGTPMSAIDELRLALDPNYTPAEANSVAQEQPQDLPQSPVLELEAALAAVAANVEPEPVVAVDPLVIDPLAVDPAAVLLSGSANGGVSDVFDTAQDAFVIDPLVIDSLVIDPVAALASDSTNGIVGDVYHNAPESMAFDIPQDASSAPQLSAIDELTRCLQEPIDEVPVTISPAVFLNTMELDSDPTTSMPMTDLATVENMVAEVLPIAKSPSPEDPFQSSLDGLVTPVAKGPTRFMVTLPLAANVRPQYLDTILGNRNDIEAHTEVFSNSSGVDPPPAVTASIDLMFKKLSDICDLPPYFESLPVMGERDMMKHATNNNSKFSFVHELIECIRDLDKKVAIISQPGRVADFIEAVVATSGVRFRRLGEESYARKAESSDPLAITICTTASEASSLAVDTDIVIVFDRDARASPLQDGRQYFHEPIVLSLVATHTLEHIDARISRSKLAPLERKNALLLSVVQARQYLVDPDRGMLEPHDAALQFGGYIRDPAVEFAWEPHPIPDEVFEVYLSGSQQDGPQVADPLNNELNENGHSRKRQMDDGNVAEDSRKRARLSESAVGYSINRGVTLSARLRGLLGGQVETEGKTVQISVDQLESLATKIDELESRMKDKDAIEQTLKQEVRNQESSLKSHVKTLRKLQPKYMEALSDRGKFESERDKAVKTAESATAKATTQEAAISKLRSEKATLEEKLAAATATLTTSSIPSVARLAEMEEQLAAAVKTAEAAAKRLKTATSDLEYSRSAYQNASNFAAELGTENAELRAKSKDLERRASDNFTTVHAANKQNEDENTRRLIQDLKARLREKDKELERLHGELKASKNGRRETRQQSAGPRSPRLPGVLSPAPRRGVGGNLSRGTSPAARGGEQIFNQQRNGRWPHLGD